MRKIKAFFDLKTHPVRTVITIIIILLASFSLLGVASIKGWEYSNSTNFCSNLCHQVHPEEPAAFQESYHAAIKCVECHMGRTGTIRAILIKTGHLKHLPAVIFRTYGRPVASESMRPASESCERCHNPLSLHGDTVREIKRYLPDENNSEKRLYMILKTGGRERDKGLSEGIHWHIVNRVEYIAKDEHKLEIPWVRITGPDGRTIEYNDTDDPISIEEIEASEKATMDCLDCHNRLGHPFLTPEKAVDEALADGRLDPGLPYIKKEVFELLTAGYDSQEDALKAAEALELRYKEKYPAAAKYSEELKDASELTRELVLRLIFRKPGITWESFPNHSGHKDFSGCFRCHDGKHVSKEGQAIPLECNLCHTIPVTVNKGDSPPEIPVASLSQPASHLEPGFIFDHRIRANEECTACHGKLTYAGDDSSFCATSACHGQSWAPFKAEPAFVHPFPLEGRHGEALCFECHRGEAKPSDQCTDCHRPPANHFAAACSDCHAPAGWKQSAAALVVRADKIAHPLSGYEECLMCHDPGGDIIPAPSGHRIYNNRQCTLCHKGNT